MRKRRADQRSYHIIYKTVCTVTNKYYIGMHSTDNLNDGYLGSGLRLRRSINKYGKEAHKREIIEFCANRKLLRKRKKEIINETLLNDEKCMNCVLGGVEPPTWLGRKLTEEHRKNLSKALKGRKFSDEHKCNLSKAQIGRIQTNETKQKISNSKKGSKPWNKNTAMNSDAKSKMINTKRKNFASGKVTPSMLGKNHTDNSKKKISLATKTRFKQNSYRWYHRTDIRQETMSACDLSKEGWIRGRLK